jgi:hypothetical protein
MLQVGNRSNESVVGQSPADMNVNTEAEYIVKVRHQATTGKDTADWNGLVRAVVKCKVCQLAIVL